MITVTEDKWEEIKERMCDEFCVWPAACPTQERLDKHCEECPLNDFENADYPLGYCPHQE